MNGDADLLDARLSELKWWSDPKNLAATQEVKDRARRDWINGHTDSLNSSASLLIDVTRLVCRGNFQDHRRALLALIKPCFETPYDSMKNVIMRAMDHRDPSRDGLLQAQFRLAEVALRVAEQHSAVQVAASVRHLVNAVLCSRRGRLTDHLPGAAGVVNSRELRAVISETLAAILASSAGEPDVLESVLQCEQAIGMMLEESTVAPVTGPALIVPLVWKGGSTLAILSVTPVESSVLDPVRNGPMLVPDLIHQRLVRFDDRCWGAMRAAVEWGVNVPAGTGLVPRWFLSRWRIIDWDSHDRSDSVTGPSAGLAAGLLVRSLCESCPIETNVCVTGAIIRTSAGFVMEPIGDCLSKFDAHRAGQTGRLIVGRRTEKDLADLTALRELGFTDIQPVETPEEAYLHVTCIPEVVQQHLRIERIRVWNSIGPFSPKRLETRLKSAAAIAQGADPLDEIHIPQLAAQPSLDASGKKVSIEKSLDDVLAQFVSGTTQRVLKILGAPGMGKTWIGLRWHLSLLETFQSEMIGRADAPSMKPMLPVWVTAYDLGRQLLRNPSLNLALGQILAQRMAANGQPEPSGDRIRQVFDDACRQNRAVLIVDAWDERERGEAEQRLMEVLPAWALTQRLIVTGRNQGEATLQSDPFWFLSAEAPWTIRATPTANLSEQSFRRWFGEDFPRQIEMIRRLRQHPSLQAMLQNPQLLSLVCWLIEQQAILNVPTAGSVIDAAIRKLLAKQANQERRHGFEDRALALENGTILTLFQKLAFHTFTADRWRFTHAELVKELTSDTYHDDRLCLSDNCQSLADLLLRSGMFQPAGTQFEVIHQALAEVLVAGYLVQNEPDFPEEAPVPQQVEFAARLGLFESRWSNVWACFASLAPRGNRFWRFLKKLVELPRPPRLPRCVPDVLGRLFMQISEQIRVEPDDDAVAEYAADLVESLLQRGIYADQGLRIGRHDLDRDTLIAVNLLSQGYDRSLKTEGEQADETSTTASAVSQESTSRVVRRQLLLQWAGLGTDDGWWHLLVQHAELHDASLEGYQIRRDAWSQLLHIPRPQLIERLLRSVSVHDGRQRNLLLNFLDRSETPATPEALPFLKACWDHIGESVDSIDDFTEGRIRLFTGYARRLVESRSTLSAADQTVIRDWLQAVVDYAEDLDQYEWRGDRSDEQLAISLRNLHIELTRLLMARDPARPLRAGQ